MVDTTLCVKRNMRGLRQGPVRPDQAYCAPRPVCKNHIRMEEFHCSFCGKQRREVRKLISGPRVFICDECVKLCNDILAKEEAAERPSYPPPKEIVSELDHFIVGDGNCLSLAYADVVHHGQDSAPDGDWQCPMCLERNDDRAALNRPGEPGWQSPVRPEAVICRRCVKMAAGVLAKDSDMGWEKPTA